MRFSINNSDTTTLPFSCHGLLSTDIKKKDQWLHPKTVTLVLKAFILSLFSLFTFEPLTSKLPSRHAVRVSSYAK
jgi:hypothetical protein